MLHTKIEGNRPSATGDEGFMGLNIYGYGGHLGHGAWTKYINFLTPLALRLHMKFKLAK